MAQPNAFISDLKAWSQPRSWTLNIPAFIMEFKAIDPSCLLHFLGLNFPICKMSRKMKQVFFCVLRRFRNSATVLKDLVLYDLHLVLKVRFPFNRKTS